MSHNSAPEAEFRVLQFACTKLKLILNIGGDHTSYLGPVHVLLNESNPCFINGALLSPVHVLLNESSPCFTNRGF